MKKLLGIMIFAALYTFPSLAANDTTRAMRDSLPSPDKVAGYPVAPYHDTLFFIYTSFGPFSPAERAKEINERLKKLYELYFIRSDSLVIVDKGQSVDIY